jgi:thiol-disulfide isomerase/thioredoxin
MNKKIILGLLLSTITMMALEVGDTIPKKIQQELKIDNNKTYVIDFFASWCKSCKKELPLVAEVYNDKVAEVIGVNVDKEQADGEKFVKILELPFPVYYDSEKTMVEAFDPMGFPAIYYVKEGKVLHVIFGAVDEIDKQITKDIKEIK